MSELATLLGLLELLGLVEPPEDVLGFLLVEVAGLLDDDDLEKYGVLEVDEGRLEDEDDEDEEDDDEDADEEAGALPTSYFPLSAFQTGSLSLTPSSILVMRYLTSARYISSLIFRPLSSNSSSSLDIYSLRLT